MLLVVCLFMYFIISWSIWHSISLNCAWWSMRLWSLNPPCCVHRQSMLHVVLCNWFQHGQNCLQNMRAMKNQNSGILFYSFFPKQEFIVTDSWHVICLCFVCRPCAEMILRFQRAAGQGQLKVTYEKYLLSDRSCVAGIKAIDRLPLWYKLCFAVSFFFWFSLFSFRFVSSFCKCDRQILISPWQM